MHESIPSAEETPFWHSQFYNDAVLIVGSSRVLNLALRTFRGKLRNMFELKKRVKAATRVYADKKCNSQPVMIDLILLITRYIGLLGSTVESRG